MNIGGGQIGIGVDQDASGNFTTPGATIDTSGSNGGGKILIGVKPDANSPTGYADAANYDFISANSTLNANATVSGIGGFIDTSGNVLQINPGAKIAAIGAGGGDGGTWQLDPTNVDIVNWPPAGSTDWLSLSPPGGASAGGTDTYQAADTTPATAYVAAGDIATALGGGINVTITTGGGKGDDMAFLDASTYDWRVLMKTTYYPGSAMSQTVRLLETIKQDTVPVSLGELPSTRLASDISALNTLIASGDVGLLQKVPVPAWGDIDVQAPISVSGTTGDPTLTLEASHNIIIDGQAGVTATGGPINVVLETSAGDDPGAGVAAVPSSDPLPPLGTAIVVNAPVKTDGGAITIVATTVSGGPAADEVFTNFSASNAWISTTATGGNSSVVLNAAATLDSSRSDGGTGGAVAVLANCEADSNSYHASIASAEIYVADQISSGGGDIRISTMSPVLSNGAFDPSQITQPGVYATHGGTTSGVQSVAASAITLASGATINSSSSGGSGGMVTISGGAQSGLDYQESDVGSVIGILAGTGVTDTITTGGGPLKIISLALAQNDGVEQWSSNGGSGSSSSLLDQISTFLEQVELNYVPFAGGTPATQNVSSAIVLNGKVDCGGGSLTVDSTSRLGNVNPPDESVNSSVIVGDGAIASAGSAGIFAQTFVNGSQSSSIVNPAAVDVATGLDLAGLFGDAATYATDGFDAVTYLGNLIEVLQDTASSLSQGGGHQSYNIARLAIGEKQDVGGALALGASASASYSTSSGSYILPTAANVDVGDTSGAGTINCGSLAVDAQRNGSSIGQINLTGQVTSNGGGQGYYAPVSLSSGNATLLDNGEGDIVFGSTLGGAGNVLSITTGGQFLYDGSVAGSGEYGGVNVVATTGSGGSGDIFVTFQSGTVGEYTTSGTPVNASLITGLGSATSIAASGGYLFITNSWAGTIAKYTTSGALVNAALVSGLDTPWAIAVSGSDLFVASANGGTIGEYTTAGAVVNENLISGLNTPEGVAISGSDLFVSNEGGGGGWVGKYTISGQTINPMLASGLFAAEGIAVSGADLFVASYNAGTINEYTTSGTPVNSFSIAGGGYTGYHPEQIAVSGSDLFVTVLPQSSYTYALSDAVGEYTTSGTTVDSAMVQSLGGVYAHGIALNSASGASGIVPPKLKFPSPMGLPQATQVAPPSGAEATVYEPATSSGGALTSIDDTGAQFGGGNATFVPPAQGNIGPVGGLSGGPPIISAGFGVALFINNDVGPSLGSVNAQFHPTALPLGLTPISGPGQVVLKEILQGLAGGAVQYEELGAAETVMVERSTKTLATTLKKAMPVANILLSTPDVWDDLVLTYEVSNWDLAHYGNYVVFTDGAGDIYAEASTENARGFSTGSSYFEIPASYLQNLGGLPWDAIP